ncbi:MAG: YegS/Rv2252/BmrU family lipid kinase [Chitinophagaceae bacterium]|nr:YegS/Rv2252/BmrU family lipid kinase [Chitinophagaceae bacterium]MBL0199081.1 YegS/Rv2252/BmrU family lipid kinase [Chitinophagaceae bacterium]
MHRKLIYLINPISGTGAKGLLLEIIKNKTAEKNIPFEILHTNAEGDYGFLKEKIAAENITDVIVCGGDGTVNQVAKALLSVAVNIGIIPMGSGNGLAFAAKIPKRIHKALECVFAGNAVYIDSFYINRKFSCMLCGLGFDAQVAHDFAKQKKRGLATYIKQSTKNFFKARHYNFEIILDGKSINSEALFISVANSNQFGNNFTIAPQASLHDGLLDIVVVNKMSKLRLIWTILKQIRSGQVRMYEDKKYHRNDIHYFQTKKLTIKNLQLAPLHIDGDPAETDAAFEIEIIENAFKLLIPA